MDRSRAARLATEAFVITTSILLAFTLDAWWDRAQEREAEQDLMVALLAEFDGVESELRRARAVHEGRAAAATALLRIIETDAPLPDADSLWTLLDVARTPTTIDPPAGVLTGAINGGELGLIRNDGLRFLLAAWQGRVDDHRKTEENIRSYAFQILLPWQAERGLNPPVSGPSPSWYARAEATIREPAHAGHLWMMQRTEGLFREDDELMRIAQEVRRHLQDGIR